MAPLVVVLIVICRLELLESLIVTGEHCGPGVGVGILGLTATKADLIFRRQACRQCFAIANVKCLDTTPFAFSNDRVIREKLVARTH